MHCRCSIITEFVVTFLMHRSVKDPGFSFEGGCIIFTVITTQLHNSIIAVERSARGLDKSKII